MGKYRSKEDIYAKLLEVGQYTPGFLRAELRDRASDETRFINEHIATLLFYKLMEEVPHRPRRYRTTEKGMEYVKIYNSLIKLIDES